LRHQQQQRREERICPFGKGGDLNRRNCAARLMNSALNPIHCSPAAEEEIQAFSFQAWITVNELETFCVV
jgi:hypothetical protein